MTLVAVENLQKSYPSSGVETEMIVNVPSFNMGEQDQLAMQGRVEVARPPFFICLRVSCYPIRATFLFQDKVYI